MNSAARLLFNVLLVAPLFSQGGRTTEQEKKPGKQKIYIAVIKTTDQVRTKGQIVNVSDSTITLMQMQGKDTLYQSINSRNIEKIIYRRRRTALAASGIVVGTLASIMLTAAASTARLTGSSDVTAFNVVPTLVFGATTIYLFTKMIASLPKTVKINGSSENFRNRKKTILKLTGR